MASCPLEYWSFCVYGQNMWQYFSNIHLKAFDWPQKSVKIYIVASLEVFINWADEKAGGYNEARQALDCCRHDSLWNTSEQYIKAAKNWKDGIISYFNTKDCLGFLSYSRGEIWPSVLAHKQIYSTFSACLLLPALLKMYSTASGEHSEIRPDKYPNPSLTIWEESKIPTS